jgi:mycothiol synthase
MQLKVRPFAADDAPAVVAVHNSSRPDAVMTIDDLAWQDAFRPPECVLKRFVAVEGEEVVGYAQYAHDPAAFHPKRFLLDGAVTPPRRRRGFGAALFDELVADLEAHAPESLTTGARSTASDTLRFLDGRGFRETTRYVEAALDLAAFDPSPFAELASDLDRRGIRLVSIDELSDDSERDRKLYELAIEVADDVPKGGEYTPPSFEQFLLYANNPSFLRDGCFVARREGRYVGLCFLLSTGRPEVVESGIVGVSREARGAGLGLGLRVKMIEHARTHGYLRMESSVEAGNEAALKMNGRLGFVAESAWLVFARTF